MKKRACRRGGIPLSSGAVMTDKNLLRSEGEQLDDILDELQRESAVREIAGWETGFANLDRALDGVRPGLYLLVGAPSIGKTAFAKQLLDQVAMKNNAAGVFFSFADSQQELRIKTLARLGSMDSREIRRGSAYLLHWYGVPRLRGGEPGEISPSWDRVRLAAEQAKGWLDSMYLIECDAKTTIASIAAQIAALKSEKNSGKIMVVIDDGQRLGDLKVPLSARYPIIVEQLQALARQLNTPLLAVWPDLADDAQLAPEAWAEKAAGADVILVLEDDPLRAKQLSEPKRAMMLNIVKNRGGERGKLAFEFHPAFANFVEVAPSP